MVRDVAQRPIPPVFGANILNTSPNSFRLLAQAIRRADSRARESAGNNSAAKIAMMAITTSNSTSVNPPATFRLIGCPSTNRLTRYL